MYLREILAISGTPGLYKYVAQGKGGIIVEALADGKRVMVSGSSKVSALGDIAIFTDSDEVALGKVFQSIYEAENGQTVAINGKSTPAELADFMQKVLPSYDQERVHNSDIKKLAQWYNTLVGAGMTDFLAEEKEEQTEQSEATETADEAAPSAKKATSATAAKAPKKPSATKVAAPKATGTASSRAKVANKSTANRKSGI